MEARTTNPCLHLTHTVDENNNIVKQYELVNDVETNVIEFVYDSNGSPIYFTYNNATYYYEKNLQGDIVAILDANGNAVVEYAYNIWGELVSITGSLADTIGAINPLRYRGYYYDTETNLYYLQSRYYSPDLMRFISQDEPYYSNEQGQPLGSNLYAYCLNNPVNLVDKDGQDAIWLQDTNAVYGAGHTGLLLQDKKGKWWHFYWGNNRNGPKGKSGSGNILLLYSGKTNLKSINKFYYKYYNKKYERTIYFKGDFSAAVSYAGGLSAKKYNLITNNCMQVSTFVLSKGYFSRSNWEYKSFFMKIRYNPIPNIAYSRMANFHSAITVWYSSSQKLRVYLISPGQAVNKF